MGKFQNTLDFVFFKVFHREINFPGMGEFPSRAQVKFLKSLNVRKTFMM